VSEEKVILGLLGSRVLTLVAKVRDLQQRFTAKGSRLTAMENRLTALASASVSGRK
jgi:hypothetical protein